VQPALSPAARSSPGHGSTARWPSPRQPEGQPPHSHAWHSGGHTHTHTHTHTRTHTHTHTHTCLIGFMDTCISQYSPFSNFCRHLDTLIKTVFSNHFYTCLNTVSTFSKHFTQWALQTHTHTQSYTHLRTHTHLCTQWALQTHTHTHLYTHSDLQTHTNTQATLCTH